MKQNLILFSILLIFSLIAETASADTNDISNITDNISNITNDITNNLTDNIGNITDNITEGVNENTGIGDTSIIPSEDVDLKVDLCFDKNGPFKAGDVVGITATFEAPVFFAEVMIEDSVYSSLDMVNKSDEDCENVWYAEYTIPEGVNGPVDVSIFATDLNGNTAEKTYTDAFIIDNIAPQFTEISPKTKFVGKNSVLFNFSAYDENDEEINYALYINDAVKETGVMASNECKEFEVELPDGYYIWEVKLKDDAGNIGSSGVKDLYVDTCAPEVELISPENCFVDSMGYLTFNFTAKDTLAAQYEELGLKYQLFIDGKSLDEVDIDEGILDGLDLDADILGEISTGSGSGIMRSGEYVEVIDGGLADGVHNWSVCVEDGTGNKVMSETRDFYVILEGLQVSLVSPSGGYVTEEPIFNFTVSGGEGLPFTYKLIVNGEEVESEDCEEGESGSLVVGKDPINHYSLEAAIDDGENIAWTVLITDCAGNSYRPDPYYFTLDTIAPESVANLCVTDAVGESEWTYAYDYPAFHVSWDANTEDDLAIMPYEVFISDFEPSCIEDMEEAEFTQLDTDLYIEKYDGENLVYGKDYWIAVIALDNAGNYDDCFAVCGPVQTYEDMDLTLDKGWNLKSVPKKLVASTACPEDVFGECSTVIYWDGCNWVFPETIEPCKGYWVYSPEDFENNIKFKPMSCDSTTPDVPPSLCLASGWQMIGHTSTQAASWDTTLSSLKGDLVDYKFSNIITYSHGEGWGGVIPDTDLLSLITGDTGFTGTDYINGTDACPVGALQYEYYMVPGQGYWVFMKEDGTYASIESANNYQDLYESDETGYESGGDETGGEETDEEAADNGAGNESSTANLPDEIGINETIEDLLNETTSE